MAAVIGRGFNKLAQGGGGGGIGVGAREPPKIYQSPFISYYVVTFAMNTVAIIGGAMSQFDSHRGRNQWYGMDRCDGWLFTNGLFGVIHILAALYIVRKIQEPEHDARDTNANANANANANQQAQHDYQLQPQPQPQPQSQQSQFRQPNEWANDPYVFATPVPDGSHNHHQNSSSNQEPIPQWVLDDYHNIEAQQQHQYQYQQRKDTKKSSGGGGGGWGGLFGGKKGTTSKHQQQQHQHQQQQQQHHQHSKNPHALSQKSGGIAKKNAVRPTGPPDSWERIKHVLCENYVVAAYILVFIIYLAWHFFSDMGACNSGMAFAMKCADVFIVAAPCALVFSLIQMQLERRRL